MPLIVALLAAAGFPVIGLCFVLWMARFEDSLPQAVRRTVRRPDPPPVLAIPIQRSKPTGSDILPNTEAGIDAVVLSRPI